MKLATTTGDFSNYSTNQFDAMTYCSAGGFKYLDYDFCTDYNRKSGIFANDTKDYADSLKKHADKLGVSFIQAHAPMGAPIAPGNADFIDANLKCIELCGMMNIKELVVHSGYEKGLSPEQTFERNKEFFLPLLHAAEKYDVNILVENFNIMCIDDLFWIDNAKDLLRMIECVNHPLFHAVWDAGHANMQKMPQNEELKILGKHVHALHVQDNNGKDDQHVAPYFGTLSIDALMTGLFDIGYKGFFTFEATNILLPDRLRTPFDHSDKARKASLDLRIKAEQFLYETGKSILSTYDCFEE